jgi:hypothetical protein
MVSASSSRQSGLGLREFVNGVNLLTDVIERVIVVDTSYLYRHKDPFFEAFDDAAVETPWQRMNGETLSLLAVEYEVVSWSTLLREVGSGETFEEWARKIEELESDDSAFASQVAATLRIHNHHGTREGNVTFLREELAVQGLALRGCVQAYSDVLSAPMYYVHDRFGLNMRVLSYEVSNAAAHAARPR